MDEKRVEEEREALKKMDEEEEAKGWEVKAREQGMSIVKGADGKVLFDKEGRPVMEKIWKKSGGGEGEGKEGEEGEAERMENEVREKTEEGMLQGMVRKMHLGK